jgi:hypothetical protein
MGNYNNRLIKMGRVTLLIVMMVMVMVMTVMMMALTTSCEQCCMNEISGLLQFTNKRIYIDEKGLKGILTHVGFGLKANIGR